MTSVAISPKFQVVIPKAVREVLKLVPGQRVEVRELNGGIFFEPVPDIMSLRGFLQPIKGVDISDVPNDPESPDWPGGCDPIPDADWLAYGNTGNKP
jgi:AbrB family looped-hinge helix DNA binding protein